MSIAYPFRRFVQVFRLGGTRFFSPILLGVLLIFIVLYVIQFGGKRESLAARAENSLIQWSLQVASRWSARTESSIVTISVLDEDLAVIRPVPGSTLRDAEIQEYARVLERVAASNPKWVVLNWLTMAHPLTQEYLKPLTDTIDRLKIHDRVTIAVNLYVTETMSADFMQTYNIMEARDCYYDVNLYCTYYPEWSWLPQQVMNRFMPQVDPWVVTTNLPHVLPNLILNLPNAKSLLSYSFLDFREPVTASLKEGSVVFIGNKVEQEFSFSENKDAIQRAKYAGSKSNSSLMRDGVPWHVFWAQMAEMIEAKRFIHVLPAHWGWSIVGLIIVFALIGMRFSSRVTLWSLFVFGVSLFFINLLTIPIFSLYIPVMPLVMSLVTFFLSATFVSVAHSSYTKSKLQFLAAKAESTADIKENFIHLISHNLNTPVAQLQGLLDLLSDRTKGESWLASANQSIELMKVVVRSVLNTATMAKEQGLVKGLPFRLLVEEILSFSSRFRKYFDVSLVMKPEQHDEEQGEIWFYSFDLDQEFVLRCIHYVCIQLYLQKAAKLIELNFEPIEREPASPKGLLVHISALEFFDTEQVRPEAFVSEALSRFFDVSQSHGRLQIERLDQSTTLKFSV